MLRDVKLAPMSIVSPDTAPEVAPEQAIEHLETVLASPFFSSSRRCQQFLRYVVLETVHGHSDDIKERNIACEVFGKGGNFEPNEDALVRVKAREVRKRLADFYQATPASGIRIELPLGGYVPHIHVLPAHVSLPPPPEPEEKRGKVKFGRREFAWMTVGALATLGGGSLAPVILRSRSHLEQLWKPVFATKNPLLIFIPALYEKDVFTGTIGMGPAIALKYASDFLGRHNYPYHLRFGQDLTYSQLREQPNLLLGSFTSEWALRMTRDLRFSLGLDATQEKAIFDRGTGKIWKAFPDANNDKTNIDYGMLCRLFDAPSGQIVMIAAGVATYGTECAARFLFDSELFPELIKQAPKDWERKNFQAIVRSSIIGMTATEPQLIATHFW